jgi:DNA-binding transcriptional ArsR family regulator
MRTVAELEKVIEAQRRQYGDALTKVAELCRQFVCPSHCNELGTMIDGIMKTYGLQTPSISLEAQILAELERGDHTHAELTKVLNVPPVKVLEAVDKLVHRRLAERFGNVYSKRVVPKWDAQEEPMVPFTAPKGYKPGERRRDLREMAASASVQVVALLEQHGQMSSAQVQTALSGIELQVVMRTLRELRKAGKIEMVGYGQGTRYMAKMPHLVAVSRTA